MSSWVVESMLKPLHDLDRFEIEANFDGMRKQKISCWFACASTAVLPSPAFGATSRRQNAEDRDRSNRSFRKNINGHAWALPSRERSDVLCNRSRSNSQTKNSQLRKLAKIFPKKPLFGFTGCEATSRHPDNHPREAKIDHLWPHPENAKNRPFLRFITLFIRKIVFFPKNHKK